MKHLIIIAFTLVLLTGCAATGPRESAGGLIGAAAGGLLGSQIGGGSGQLAATAIGVLAGALLGSQIGRDMDAADRTAQRRATGVALESASIGSSLPWKNPNSGNSGLVTPTRTFQQSDGTYCREFTQTVTVGGRTEQAYGTACRQADGSWKIVG
jgi:surface antigen